MALPHSRAALIKQCQQPTGPIVMNLHAGMADLVEIAAALLRGLYSISTWHLVTVCFFLAQVSSCLLPDKTKCFGYTGSPWPSTGGRNSKIPGLIEAALEMGPALQQGHNQPRV